MSSSGGGQQGRRRWCGRLPRLQVVTAWDHRSGDLGGLGSWVAELEEGTLVDGQLKLPSAQSGKPGLGRPSPHSPLGWDPATCQQDGGGLLQATGQAWGTEAGPDPCLSPRCQGRAQQVGNSLTDCGWQELGAGRGLLVCAHPRRVLRCPLSAPALQLRAGWSDRLSHRGAGHGHAA